MFPTLEDYFESQEEIEEFVNSHYPNNSVSVIPMSEPSLGDILKVELEISEFPKLGETAILTANLTNIAGLPYPSGGNENFAFQITEHFEFVGIDSEQINTHGTGDYVFTTYGFSSDMAVNESILVQVQIKAISEGDGLIIAKGSFAEGEMYEVVIDSDQTLLASDYYKLFPEKLLDKQLAIELQSDTDIWSAPYDEETGCFVTQGKQVCKYDPDNENSTTTIKELRTEQETRDSMKEMGYTDEEIEEYIKNEFSISTQSFSSDNFDIELQSAEILIDVTGVLKTDTVGFMPDSVSHKDRMNGIKACAIEADLVTDKQTVLDCDDTNRFGTYSIQDVKLPSDSVDGTLDIYVEFYTDGEFVYVANSQGLKNPNIHPIPYFVTSNFESNVSSNIQLDFQLVISEYKSSDFERAFWIADSIKDAHDWIESDDGFDFEIDERIEVVWNPSADTTYFGGSGGAYYSSAGTIYLTGYNATGSEQDDAYERNTIIHEYGHFVMDEMYDDDEYPLEVRDCFLPNGDPGHRIYQVSGASCAVAEGFADILPHLVDSSALYIQRDKIWFDMEEATMYLNTLDSPWTVFADEDTNGNPVGHLVEGRFGASIWDIMDDNEDSVYDKLDGVEMDKLHENPDTIKTVLVNADPQTVKEFAEEWNDNYSSSNDIMKLHFMEFAHPDSVNPEIEITRPLNGERITSSTVTVRGEATDDRGIESIAVSFDHPDMSDVDVSVTQYWTALNVPLPTTGNGKIDIEATVTDLQGNIGTDTIHIFYGEEDDDSPKIKSISKVTSTASEPISFDAEVEGDSTNVEFSLDKEPTGASITKQGSFSWTPTEEQIGIHKFDFIALDTISSLSDTQEVEF